MSALRNMPEIRIGIVGVSRDCFPLELSRRRTAAVVEECRKLGLDVVGASTIIETEGDALVAAAELEHEGVHAAAVYLGNFGPEGPTTIFAKLFGRPFMLCGAAEESRATLVDGRGDALCGMLNACLNAGLRHLRPHVPPMPIGLPRQVARMVADFVPVARVAVGVKGLKVFAFGPRPQDFYACDAPIRPLYDLGIEVMENSELDLYVLYKDAAKRTTEIEAVAKDMERELGKGNRHPEKLRQLAQFEVALLEFFDAHLGSRSYGVFADKCWPAFEKAFGFVPCFVNSRLAGRGIPAACEVDIYGAVSEYMIQLASDHPATILDVNNSVPDDLPVPGGRRRVDRSDLFMAFHCGNTPSGCLCDGCSMKHQLIMHRLMEPGRKPDITCGTLEGTIRPGPATLFRLQAAPAGGLMSYIADGEVLEADPSSFGAIGVVSIPGFARFYRHVLLERQFPHHAAVGFRPAGRALFDALRLLGVDDIQTPRPAGVPYPSENPFSS